MAARELKPTKVPTLYVYTLSNCLKMLRVNAESVTTNVIEDKSVWYGPMMHLIGNSVGAVAFAIHGKVAVLFACAGTYPNPATTVGFWKIGSLKSI